jgi:hypothetical protein
MKILFVLPKFNKGQGLIYDPNDSTPDYNYLIPIGMPYIAAYLKQNGYTDVHGINLNHHCGTVEQQVKEAVSKTHYDVIFTGGLSSAFREIKEMVRFIREGSPGTIVVVGGGLISSEPEVVMPLIKPDFGIIFEGEETALALLRWIESGDIAPEQIAGITFLRGGNIVLSPKREAIKDLDKLPYPDLDLFGYEEYISNQFTGGWNLYSRDHNPRPYVLVGSRGCPGGCTFCFHTTGPKYYQRSIDNIMAEIRYAVEKYKINFFTFQDELFAYDKPRALEFCRQFGDYIATLPYTVEMYCDPSILWCVSYEVTHRDGKEIPIREIPGTHIEIGGIGGIMFRRECLERVKKVWSYLFLESLGHTDDGDLSLRLIHYPVKLIPVVLSHYRWHDENLTSQTDPIEQEWGIVKMIIRNGAWRLLPYHLKNLILIGLNNLTGYDLVKTKKEFLG